MPEIFWQLHDADTEPSPLTPPSNRITLGSIFVMNTALPVTLTPTFPSTDQLQSLHPPEIPLPENSPPSETPATSPILTRPRKSTDRPGTEHSTPIASTPMLPLIL